MKLLALCVLLCACGKVQPDPCRDNVAVIDHNDQNSYSCMPNQDMTIKQLYGDTLTVECRCIPIQTDAGKN